MEAKKIGRPTESKKDSTIRVRMNKETVNRLDECVNKINENSNNTITRSQLIRAGVDETYESIITNEDMTKCEQLMGRINRKK